MSETPPPAPGSQSINDLNNLRGLAKVAYGSIPKHNRKRRKFKIFDKYNRGDK